jgi:alkyl sulfatase BDS1-like metallo-beta-lactamase superfamily hydrolase
MSGFADATIASETMKAVIAQVDSASLESTRIVYSYRFTDIDWSFTLIVQEGAMQMFEGILPESETTIETTSGVFDKVMTGAMNVATAHLTNQARIRGSVGNILALRTIVPVLSEAYRAVREAQTYRS